jgi:hypothetical protein
MMRGIMGLARGPFVKRKVGGDERAATLVALAQHLEQQFVHQRGGGDERHTLPLLAGRKAQGQNAQKFERDGSSLRRGAVHS